MNRNQIKKEIEGRALKAARSAGVPIPLGETPGEEPDFRFNADSLGIEVSELLRPASSNFGIVPAAETTFHTQVVQMAQEQYHRVTDAKPVRVVLYFTNARGQKRDKQDLARTLAEFVRTNAQRARPYAGFERSEVPDSFGHIGIAAESGDWICSEGGSFTVSDIHRALASSIAAKNKLLPAYRKNLASGARVWLLLYSTASVSRGMSIPHGIGQWRFDFDFDKVFWFVSLGNEFVEIQRQLCSNSNKC